eukprot:Skav221464  [mRNA]  locus=scaffold1700:296615:300058:+ [translate_table: standard]
MEDKKLPEHSQRRFCFYELRGGVHEFALAASKLLSSDGKFCIVHVHRRTDDVLDAVRAANLVPERRLTALARGEPKWQGGARPPGALDKGELRLLTAALRYAEPPQGALLQEIWGEVRGRVRSVGDLLGVLASPYAKSKAQGPAAAASNNRGSEHSKPCLRAKPPAKVSSVEPGRVCSPCAMEEFSNHEKGILKAVIRDQERKESVGEEFYLIFFYFVLFCVCYTIRNCCRRSEPSCGQADKTGSPQAPQNRQTEQRNEIPQRQASAGEPTSEVDQGLIGEKVMKLEQDLADYMSVGKSNQDA